MSRNKPSKKGTRSRTDKEKLELFVKRVNELQQTRLTINGCRISHNIHYEAGQTIQSKLEQPEEADFKEHLLTFRHFISEKEDTFLSRIFGILYVRCIDVSNKQSIVELRKAYETVKLHNNLQIIVNNEKYTPLRITDIYLNSKYFHNDLEEWEFLDNLDPLTTDMFRAHFLNFVIDTSKILMIVRNNIEHCIKENWLDFSK